MKHSRARAWWLLPLLPLACDGGLRLVVVEQTDSSSVAGGGGSGVGATSAGSSVIPEGGVSPLGGSGQGNATGMSGSPDMDSAAGAAGAPPLDVPFWAVPARYTASFTAYAFPEQFIRYTDDKGFIAPIDMTSLADQEAASFEMTPGLYKSECSSFRAVNKIGTFFRHSGSRLYMQPASDLPLYLADATFCEEAGMADPAGVTFRSSNYPTRVIHLRNKNELWIDDVPATDAPEYADFAAQSTFYEQTALNENVSP